MDWLQQYSAALEARDAREQAHKPYIDAYTALADRTSQRATEAPAPATEPQTTSSKDRLATPTKTKAAAGSETSHNDLLTALRSDLASTQKARSSLQTQLADVTAQLSALSIQQKATQAQATALTKQKLDAERKLRDRDDELRGKSKLVEQAQDEMVALGLQLNLSEEKSEKLHRENKELVERWMKRMGEEVDRVNRDSRWQ